MKWKELSERVKALYGNDFDTEGKTREELRDLIARKFITDDTLPQYHPMCGYDGTMEMSERGDGFWKDVEGAYYAEPKLDEIRCMVFFIGGKVRLQSRGRHKHTQLYHEMTENFPQFQKLYKPELEGLILDGGLVAGLDKNRTRNIWKGNDLLLAMRYVSSSPEKSQALQKEFGEPELILWDVIALPKVLRCPVMGYGLGMAPIEIRRRNLEFIAKRLGLRVVPRWRSNLKHYYERVVATGGEGIMLKKKRSRYHFRRSTDWIKVKRYEDVVGYVHSKKSDGKGAWTGLVGSINIADEDGNIIGGVGNMELEIRKKISLPDGSLNPVTIGKKVLIRYYMKNQESGNPRHCRLIAWLDDFESDVEETIKEEEK